MHQRFEFDQIQANSVPGFNTDHQAFVMIRLAGEPQSLGHLGYHHRRLRLTHTDSSIGWLPGGAHPREQLDSGCALRVSPLAIQWRFHPRLQGHASHVHLQRAAN